MLIFCGKKLIFFVFYFNIKMLIFCGEKSNHMTLPKKNQTPTGFLSEFFNLKYCIIRNILEDEISVSQTHTG